MGLSKDSQKTSRRDEKAEDKILRPRRRPRPLAETQRRREGVKGNRYGIE